MASIDVGIKNDELGKVVSQEGRLVGGDELFRWPEFKALALRLGLPWGKPIKRLVLDLQYDAMATMLVEMVGEDCQPTEVVKRA